MTSRTLEATLLIPLIGDHLEHGSQSLVRHDLSLVHMGKVIKLSIRQISILVTAFDLSIRVVDDQSALTGQSRVLR